MQRFCNNTENFIFFTGPLTFRQVQIVVFLPGLPRSNDPLSRPVCGAEGCALPSPLPVGGGSGAPNQGSALLPSLAAPQGAPPAFPARLAVTRTSWGPQPAERVGKVGRLGFVFGPKAFSSGCAMLFPMARCNYQVT